MAKTIEHKAADRSNWGRGPWDAEPDREQFRHANMACLLQRGPSGAWCGYVAVPPGHPLYEKDYWDFSVRVHGGLTYAEHCQGSICHVPAPGEPDNVWWLGFDCSHCDDESPTEAGRDDRRYGGTYRDIEYVREQTRWLAEQVAIHTGGSDAE